MKTLPGLLLAAMLTGFICAAAPIAISNAPIAITQPGEYFLANDLIIRSEAPTAAIDIRASNVVLNLNGHAVRYAGPNTFELRNGIQARYNSVIYNGRVRGWTSVGILMVGEFNGNDPVPGDGRIQSVVASECGIGIAAAGGKLRFCQVRDSETGIYVRQADVKFCTARSNRTGYFADDTNTFNRCRATENELGFHVTAGNSIEGCVARENGTGIYVEGGAGTVIRGCTISRSELRGINLNEPLNVLIQRNTFLRNGKPTSPASPLFILRSTGTRVERNRFIRNYPNEIHEQGEGAVLLDNIFRPQ